MSDAKNVIQMFGQMPLGSPLCTITLYREPDGVIRSQLDWMDAGLIETTGTDVSSRMMIVAEWIKAGHLSMENQANQFKETNDE